MSSVPYFTLAERVGALPFWTFEDTDANWHHLLSAHNIRLGPTKQDKIHLSRCLRGVTFRPEAPGPEAVYVDRVYGLVLDIDDPQDDRGLPANPEDLHAMLEGHRCIIYTTYSHSHYAHRWRLVVPLAQPVSGQEFAALFNDVNALIGHQVKGAQHNPDRIGYLHCVPNEEAWKEYRYWILDGPRLDPYARFGEFDYHLAKDYKRVQTVAEPNRADWCEDDEAERRARRYFKDAHKGVEEGSRHHKLIKISCQLWWDFWLPAERVFAVLSDINKRFDVPKSEDDIHAEVKAGFDRTRGRSAVSQECEPGAKRLRRDQISSQRIAAFAERVKRDRSSRTAEVRKELAVDLRKVSDGRPLLEVEDTTPELLRERYYGILRELTTEFAEANPNAIADFISSSVEAQNSLYVNAGQQPPLDLVAIYSYTLNTQREHLLTKQQAEENLAQQVRIQIQTLFANGRDYGYTESEVAAYARQQGVTYAEFLSTRLVVVCDYDYYFFKEGTYIGPMKNKEVLGAIAEEYLAPFVHLGVSTTYMTDDGPKDKDLKELVRDYGSSCQAIEYDATGGFSRIDTDQTTAEKVKVLRISKRRRRDLQAEYQPEVDRWLTELCPPDILPNVKYWLANLTNLHEPDALLVLAGQGGVGKSLLVRAVNRLWTTNDPVPLSELSKSFQPPDVLKTPLVSCEEGLPKAFQARDGLERLRDLIQSRELTINQKYVRQQAVNGALRFIITTNNGENVIPQLGNLEVTKEGAEATEQRILWVEAQQGAENYLKSLHPLHVAAFVEKDLVAKYALWLAQDPSRTQYTLPPNKRRFPSAGGTQPLRKMSALNSVVEIVLSSVYDYYQAPGLMDDDYGVVRHGLYWVQGPDGAVYVAMKSSAIQRLVEIKLKRTQPAKTLSTNLKRAGVKYGVTRIGKKRFRLAAFPVELVAAYYQHREESGSEEAMDLLRDFFAKTSDDRKGPLYIT